MTIFGILDTSSGSRARFQKGPNFGKVSFFLFLIVFFLSNSDNKKNQEKNILGRKKKVLLFVFLPHLKNFLYFFRFLVDLYPLFLVLLYFFVLSLWDC